MLTALIVMIALAAIATFLMARMVIGIFKSLRGRDREQQQKQATASEQNDKKDKTDEKKEKKEVSEDQQKNAQEDIQSEAEQLYSLQEMRVDNEIDKGIHEDFWMEQTEFSIDGKLCADLCVAQTSLSYIEFNNRSMANDSFFGFNLFIEDNHKMTLTYNGQAIATLTRVEKESIITKDGVQEKVKTSFYRTNTFPPHLSSLMIASDVDQMIAAREAINACAGDPAKVADVMMERFMKPENVNKLRRNIVMKIQAKESGFKRDISSQKKPARSARSHMAS